MLFHKANPVDSFDNLRERVERMLKTPARRRSEGGQFSLEFPSSDLFERPISIPSDSVRDFLNFLSAVVPDGDMYLFGGVLRDMALLGRRGFTSDIDLVIEGNWPSCVDYLERLGAKRNKFGGYRLEVAGWPIDIWSARETWAIRNGFVEYNGVASLIETTVLNWDAVLMNWRTKKFISRKNYLSEIKERILDVVLEENPDKLGMAVRVFRHLCIKDARKVSRKAARYLASATAFYSYEELKEREIKSYRNSAIDFEVYRFFSLLNSNLNVDFRDRVDLACQRLKQEGLSISNRQAEWDFSSLVD